MKIFLLLISLILSINKFTISKEFMVLQSTTSTRDSGFYDHLLPIFFQESGIEVRVVAVGTGQAIKNARKCDADVLITHHKKSENQFVKDGFGRSIYRRKP